MASTAANVNADAGSSVEGVELLYFKRCTDRLQSASTPESKKLDLLRRLRGVKVSLEVLAASGIGKAVNACRDGSRSQLDSLAAELVNSWKRAVDTTLTRKPELLAAAAAAAHSPPSSSTSPHHQACDATATAAAVASEKKTGHSRKQGNDGADSKKCPSPAKEHSDAKMKLGNSKQCSGTGSEKVGDLSRKNSDAGFKRQENSETLDAAAKKHNELGLSRKSETASCDSRDDSARALDSKKLHVDADSKKCADSEKAVNLKQQKKQHDVSMTSTPPQGVATASAEQQQAELAAAAALKKKDKKKSKKKKDKKEKRKKKKEKQEEEEAASGKRHPELLTAGEFDNSIGLTFEACLDLVAAQKKEKLKKKKKASEQQQQQQQQQRLPELPVELNLGISEAPIVKSAGSAAAEDVDDTGELAMPVKSYSRSAVYSGRARNGGGTATGGGADAVPTLRQACLNYLAAHIDWLGDLGPGVPYHVVKPVLQKCSSEQLLRLEGLNRHLIGDDDELWELHYDREFGHLDKLSDDGDDDEGGGRGRETYWRRRYLTAMRRQREKLRSVTERMTTSLELARQQQRHTKLTLIDRPPDRKRRHREADDAAAGGTTLKFSAKAKKAKVAANPARAQLVEQLSSHILPTAGAPLSVMATPPTTSSSSSSGSKAGAGGGGSRSKAAPLMSKTLRQMQRLKASGYRV